MNIWCIQESEKNNMPPKKTSENKRQPSFTSAHNLSRTPPKQNTSPFARSKGAVKPIQVSTEELKSKELAQLMKTFAVEPAAAKEQKKMRPMKL